MGGDQKRLKMYIVLRCEEYLIATDFTEFRWMKRLYGEVEIIMKELGMTNSNVLLYISCENTEINCNKTVNNVRHDWPILWT
jgi:hypothetical protein